MTTLDALGNPYVMTTVDALGRPKVKITQTKIKSSRVNDCIRLSSPNRSLYLCLDLDNAIYIREEGFEEIRWSNWHQALIDCRRELSAPCSVFSPDTLYQPANPITWRRNALKSGKIKGWAPRKRK